MGSTPRDGVYARTAPATTAWRDSTANETRSIRAPMKRRSPAGRSATKAVAMSPREDEPTTNSASIKGAAIRRNASGQTTMNAPPPFSQATNATRQMLPSRDRAAHRSQVEAGPDPPMLDYESSVAAGIAGTPAVRRASLSFTTARCVFSAVAANERLRTFTRRSAGAATVAGGGSTRRLCCAQAGWPDALRAPLRLRLRNDSAAPCGGHRQLAEMHA